MDIDRIKSESRGRWQGIFHELGIEVGTGKHLPCPAPGCGGRNRFRFTDKDGLGGWYCNQCEPHAGDGFSLVMKCTGMTFIEAVKKVSELIGVIEVDFKPNKPKKDPSIYLNKVWKSSFELSRDDPVLKYLQSRGITFMPENVRYCPECWESDTKQNYPAMVSRITNKDGKPIGLHVTYLKDGKKADVPSPKKIMPPVEPLNGAAIRLSYPKDDCLRIAEGIESALSVSTMFGTAVWAVMSTSLMEAFEPPEHYKRIVIYADNDASFAGQKAAYVLATKLYNKGLSVDIRMPPDEGQDFNDILIATLRLGAQDD